MDSSEEDIEMPDLNISRLVVAYAKEDEEIASAFVSYLVEGAGVSEHSTTLLGLDDNMDFGGIPLRQALRSILNGDALFIPILSDSFFQSTGGLLTIGHSSVFGNLCIPFMLPSLDTETFNGSLSEKLYFSMNDPKQPGGFSHVLDSMKLTDKPSEDARKTAIDKFHAFLFKAL